MIQATATPAKSLLTPTDHALVFIDFQSQMTFATHSIDIPNLRNNVAQVAGHSGASTASHTKARRSWLL